MESFAIIEKSTGKILMTYSGLRPNLATGGYADQEKYEHKRLPKQAKSLSFLRYDFATEQFVIDSNLKTEHANKIKKLLKEEIHLYMWRHTDWSQLPDVRLNEQEKREWRQYREFLRDYDNFLGDLSKFTGIPDILSFEEWKAMIAQKRGEKC